MRYFSGFSGIGGFELGIERAIQKIKDYYAKRGISMPKFLQTICIGFSEIDKYAIATYLKHFPTHKNYGNARDIDPKDLPYFDMFCGGFPCQSFSIAGKRKGFQDTRGTLFHEIRRIVAVKKPRLLFLENVKGLLSADDGRCFATIISSLDELGYDVEWQVLNSKHFGVPQSRERVFIIGHLRGQSSRQVFPIGIGNDKYNEKREEGFGIANTLTSSYCRGQQANSPHIMYKQKSKQQYSRVYSVDGISPTLVGASKLSGDCTPKIIPVLTPDREEKRQNGRRFKEDGEPSFTLTGQDIHGVMKEDRIRRLTPTECERLQGFPDGWTIGSDTQRYKQCGNAVTVNVIEAIMNNVIFTKLNQGDDK